MMPFIWTTSVLLALQILLLNGHPQCTDFRPPFKPAAPPLHCLQYAESGCCTAQQDGVLKSSFAAFLIRHGGASGTSSISDACRQRLKAMQCLFCSPYAAHAFDVEETGTEIGNGTGLVPGLCPGECEKMQLECGPAVVNEFFSLPNHVAEVTGVSEFCHRWTLNDSTYCYPNIADTERLLIDGPVTNTGNPLSESGTDCLCVEVVAEQLVNPLTLASSRDGTGRLFIGEQKGIIKILTSSNVVLALPYLELSNKVGTYDGHGDERGLLGIEFHPDFKSNSLFYVYYSEYTSSGKHFSRISEWRQSPANPNRALDSSERLLLSIEQPSSNHNGGQLTFGPDGYLYIFSGDGGGAGDKHGLYGNAQNLTNLLGKVLRIDVNTGIPDALYAIPPDNPFASGQGQAGVRREIFAYGLRNPWRCSFDRGHPETGEGRGRLFCGDVGQKRREEIDIIVNGGNYGWRGLEGTRCYDKKMCPALRDVSIPPIYEYSHRVGRSVTGGYVYRGCQWPNLQGKYIYGDYDSGKLYTLTEDSTSATGWTNKEICFGTSSTCTNRMSSEYVPRILSFGEDNYGEVYILATANHRSEPLGKIYRLVDPSRRSDPTTCQSRSTAAVASKQAAVPPTNSLSEDECKQCQTNQLTGWSYDEICASNHTHYLKIHVLYKDLAFAAASEGLLLVQVLDWYGSAPPGPAGDRRPSYTFMYIAREAIDCDCPRLVTGNTYLLLAEAADYIFELDLKAVSVLWNDEATPTFIDDLRRVKEQCPS